MNTAKPLSASSAIAMTAILFSGVANLADSYYAPNAVMAAAVTRGAVSITAAATLVDAKPAAVRAAANTVAVRVGTLDNAMIAKWNRLNQANDSRTMVA